MEEKYDVIILGTGLKEGMLSGVLSTAHKRVLHLDRNSYYGAEAASLNLKQMYDLYKPEAEIKSDLGDHKDYIIDICPKILKVGYHVRKEYKIEVNMLNQFINFKGIDNIFGYASGRIRLVPGNEQYALAVGEMIFSKSHYSLNRLPEAFASQSKAHGGVFMLNKPVDKILYDAVTGRVIGISSQGQNAYCRLLVGDPSYFAPADSTVKGHVARCVYLLRAPHFKTYGSSHIYVPGDKVGRRNNVYVVMLSAQHGVAPKGMFLLLASSLAETQNPREELVCLRTLYPFVAEEFYFETELRIPTAEFNARDDGTFMTATNDETNCFETYSSEVDLLFERVMKKIDVPFLRVWREHVESLKEQEKNEKRTREKRYKKP